MKQPIKTRISRAADILLTAATLLVAALLIVQCAGIYLTGTSPENMAETGVRIRDIYSREIVAERFSMIAWAFVLWLAVFIVAVLARIISRDASDVKPEISPETRLKLMMARVSSTPAMKAEERKRVNAALLCGAACLICGALGGAYMLTPANFASRELEGVMGRMTLHIAPLIAIAFAALMLYAQARRQSVLRELEIVKDAPKRTPEPQPAHGNNLPLIAGRVALYAAAVALIVAGIMNGGMYDVLVKAINICTECIGLG